MTFDWVKEDSVKLSAPDIYSEYIISKKGKKKIEMKRLAVSSAISNFSTSFEYHMGTEDAAKNDEGESFSFVILEDKNGNAVPIEEVDVNSKEIPEELISLLTATCPMTFQQMSVNDTEKHPTMKHLPDGIRAKDIPCPNTIPQMLKSEYREGWLQSIEDELTKLRTNDTFAYVEVVPEGVKLIGNRYVWTVKSLSTGGSSTCVSFGVKGIYAKRGIRISFQRNVCRSSPWQHIICIDR